MKMKKINRRHYEPRFSFFHGPISNRYPSKDWTLLKAWEYITLGRSLGETEWLRAIDDPELRRCYKKYNFDFITPSGTFSVRDNEHLICHSGLLCLDFDHLPDVEDLFARLLEDEYFQTELLFRSPSGDGLKWIIPISLDKATHANWFKSVSAYCEQTYDVLPDQMCGDVARACFLPYDPNAYLNPERRPKR